MTVRAIIFGLLLAALLASVTYFNDWVIVQTHLVGNHLPIGVFGALLLLMLVGGPLFRLMGRKWALKPSEIAIIAAFGLTVAAWPGSNFFRTFTPVVALPGHDYRSKPGWQAAGVLSYLPGGSADVAAGHVRDWDGLLKRLTGSGELKAVTSDEVVSRFDDEQKALLKALTHRERLDSNDRRRMLDALNDALIEPTSLEDAKPLHALLPEAARDDRVVESLARRDRAQQRVEELLAEKQTLEQSLAEAKQALAGELDPLLEQSKTLRQQLADLRRQRSELEAKEGADPSKLAALEKSITQTEWQQAEVLGELEPLQDRLAIKQRDVTRAQWQLTYYEDLAQRMERRANRAALVTMMPEIILPQPRGEGVLLNDGFRDPYATDTLVQGWDGKRGLRLSDLPWWAWWPTIKTWGGMALLLAAALLCLALIVHPQWSRRELLPYPIVKFVDSIAETEEGGTRPKILRSRLFWIGLGLALGIHVVNGLNAWFPDYVLKIPLNLQLWPLKKLFEDAGKTPNTWALWAPQIFLSLVGFSFFLNKQVSFSVGVSLILWAALGGFLISRGVVVSDEFYGTAMNQMLRFGAYVGMAVIILYIGRRYYLNVAWATVGGKCDEATPGYVPWAGRGFVVSIVMCVLVLHFWVGLDWVLSCLFLLCVLIMSIVMARINVETGVIFAQPFWQPVGVLTAMVGMAGLGPEAFLALAIASAVVMMDPRESLMPFLNNALRLAEGPGETKPTRALPWMALILVGGFVIALVATTYLMYSHGAGTKDAWARSSSRYPMQRLTVGVAQLEASGELTASNEHRNLDRLWHASPESEALGWMGLGFGLVLVCALARLRFAWWPLHPVAFLIWGTYPANRVFFSFLLGWAIKSAVTKFGGAKGYHAVLPFMVGLIAGEIFGAFIWTLVGGAYFLATGKTPVSVHILPA